MDARRIGLVLVAATVGTAGIVAGGCSTAPPANDVRVLTHRAGYARTWFEDRVVGLNRQIERSAGYISFPSVGQVGVIIAGGKYGRGVVCEPDGTQIGWASINTASAGLQLGAQDFKMLVVFEDPATLRRFQQDKLTGNVSATAVAGEAGSSGAASFTEGVAIYQGDSAGLMAGVSIGLDLMRYEPLQATR
ncbi:MAG: YSC84-related protein [Phycisphaerales bacterium]